MGNVLDNAAIIFVQRPAVLGDTNPRHPFVQLVLVVGAKVPDVLGIFGLGTNTVKLF